MGEFAFTKVQYGMESASVHGTAVAATALFPGMVKVPADRTPKFPKLLLGQRADTNLVSINQIFADGIVLSMDDGMFNRLPWLFGMGLKGAVVSTETTSGQGDYAWDFTHSLTAANAPDSFTLEFGDDTQAYEVEYLLAKQYKISGRLGEDAGVSVQATCFGRQITPTTFTASLTHPTYAPMVANLAKFYSDSAWAGLGGTQVTDVLRSFDITIDTGIHAKYLANASKLFSTHGEGVPNLVATFVLEGNSSADAIFDYFQAGTSRALRLLLEGTQIGSGAKHSLTIDMYGVFESVIPINEQAEGNNLHAAVFRCLSDNQSTPHTFAVKVTTNASGY